MNPITWLRIGAIFGALGVTMGAFGAHGLKGRLDERALEVFETGARYQMYHAFALIAVGLLGHLGHTGKIFDLAGWGFFVGTLIFSGTLYVLTVFYLPWLGRITPIGGILLILGWIALAIAVRSTPSVTERKF